MDGLREVHSHGLLHRDISPDNVYITGQGTVKILDFGAARMAVGERSQSLSLILKEGYAPEEQYRRSGNQGPWTDVYAVGATLYRCLTGVTPPPALDRLHDDTLKSPSQMGVAIPPEAESALMRALAVSAANRFRSIEGFESALTAAAHQLPPLVPFSAPPQPSNPFPEAPAVTPAYKLYDSGSVGLATFLGSPIAGGVLMAINSRRIYRHGAFKWVLAGIGITVVAGGIGYFLPSYTATGIAIALLFLMRAIAKSAQGQNVEEHVRQGGRTASRWAAAGISLAFLVVLVGAVIGGALGYDAWTNPKVIIRTRDEVYYRGTATRFQAETLGSKLRDLNYFSDQGASVILSDGANGRVISFVVKDGTWDDLDILDGFEELGRNICDGTLFTYPIHIQLLNAQREVRKDLIVAETGDIAGYQIYYFGAATEGDAKELAKYLKTAGYQDTAADIHPGSVIDLLRDNGRGSKPKTIVFLAKNNGRTEITFPVKDGEWDNDTRVAALRKLVYAGGSALGGLPVELRISNLKYVPQKRVTVSLF
jgi:hypothetical protein